MFIGFVCLFVYVLVVFMLFISRDNVALAGLEFQVCATKSGFFHESESLPFYPSEQKS